MKVLWVSNIIPEDAAKKYGLKASPMGGWIMSMANELIKYYDLQLAIATTGSDKGLLSCAENGIDFFILDGGLRRSEKIDSQWREIVDKWKPDIVHLQGTEFNFAEFLTENSQKKYKKVVSIQGIVSEYANYYTGYIKKTDIIRNLTCHDLLRQDIYQEQKEFEKRGVDEIRMLKKADIIIGRTDWDKGVVNSLGCINAYRHCGENLRSVFYENEWSYQSCKPHSIFFSQAASAIKGFHLIIPALCIVKRDYPDLLVRIAGVDVEAFSKSRFNFRRHGYYKYIHELLKKYDLLETVHFTGLLNEKQIIKEYLSANCFVQSSVIENSPNSLGEALLLGVPSVASMVGGTANFIDHKKNGYLYPVEDYKTAALYIEEIFCSKDRIVDMSSNERQKAQKYYDRQTNSETMYRIYKELMRG